jgi:tRNA(adenine34) deaminase
MDSDMIDRLMMTRCIELAKASGKAGEYPYAAVIGRRGKIVAESMNQVKNDRDVTRHAEMTAIAIAQKKLSSVSLDDCDIYANAEPCVMCSFAIRESRIRRVIYGLSSPHMGGHSKWNVLSDSSLSTTMPEVFAPPPEIVSGYMEKEAEQGLIQWNPLIALIIKRRGLFGSTATVANKQKHVRFVGGCSCALRFLRRNFFDYFGRR